MGHSSKRLKIVAYGGVEEWEEIRALAAQGHEIVTQPDWEDLKTADMILGPTAQRMSVDERTWVLEAIRAVHQRKYPRGKEPV